MTQTSHTAAGATPRAFGAGYLFGVPLGDLGWFSSLLIGVASGFMAFFASTFCAIVAVLFYNSLFDGEIDFALTYRRVGFPAGVAVMAVALGYLGTLWLKRVLRRS
jgi:ABC-type dipeptide/oligopeptide/nickel transport system permease subunit